MIYCIKYNKVTTDNTLTLQALVTRRKYFIGYHFHVKEIVIIFIYREDFFLSIVV